MISRSKDIVQYDKPNSRQKQSNSFSRGLNQSGRPTTNHTQLDINQTGQNSSIFDLPEKVKNSLVHTTQAKDDSPRINQFAYFTNHSKRSSTGTATIHHHKDNSATSIYLNQPRVKISKNNAASKIKQNISKQLIN
ncbi:UNKNOWN [Stylonychia lemnae]|uniref:Uncharacterized protein n=1 Tax=Stylonychia lemnae TaxID=5949 RepID=A0A078AIY8_STYLE|nr:UNKNOWN [Stylonychia lemnae]|eukprot:CDW81422.1 UNKNOWN [Stylonychia lemnae]